MKRYMVAVEDRERIKTLLNKESFGWRKERLVALQMGFQPHHTIDDIGAVVGRGKATIQRWFDKYRAQGLGAALTRAYYKSGIKSRCDEEVEAFLQQIKKQYPEEEHVVAWDGAGFHPHDSEHPNVPQVFIS